MLLELLNYTLNAHKYPTYIKELKLLHDLIALESRSKRLKHSWEQHLSNTKSFILDSIETIITKKYNNVDIHTTTKLGKVLILGSGLINDLPLEFLSNKFSEVILIDIIHLDKIKDKYSKLSNIKWIELDITDTLELAYNLSKNFLGHPNHINSDNLEEFTQQISNFSKISPNYYTNGDIDLVISLNLLSQLPLCIQDYIEKSTKKITKKLNQDQQRSIELALNKFHQSLISNHLKYLSRFIHSPNQSQVIIISDFQKDIYDKANNLIYVKDSLQDLLKLNPQSKPCEGIKNLYKAHLDINNSQIINEAYWDWDLAPIGELDRKYAMKLKVYAALI